MRSQYRGRRFQLQALVCPSVAPRSSLGPALMVLGTLLCFHRACAMAPGSSFLGLFPGVASLCRLPSAALLTLVHVQFFQGALCDSGASMWPAPQSSVVHGVLCCLGLFINSVHGLLGCPGFLLLKQCRSERLWASPVQEQEASSHFPLPILPLSPAAPCFYPHFQGRPRSARESSGDSEEEWKEPQGWRTGILGFSPDLVTFLGFIYSRAVFSCGSKIIHAGCSAEQLGHIVGA